MSSLNIKSLDELRFSDSLKNHSDIHSIIEVLVKKIKEINSYEELHLNVDLIVYICKSIDQILADSKLKNIDKFNLFKEIYIPLFPETTEKEIRIIKAIIEYLHGIGNIVAVKTNFGKFCKGAKSFLKVVLSVLSLS
jgi:formyltetrahydrofolate synthetase